MYQKIHLSESVTSFQSELEPLTGASDVEVMDVLQKAIAGDLPAEPDLEEPIDHEIEAIDADSLQPEEVSDEPEDISRLDQIAVARPSGYSKTLSDDAVGAFFKEMARYPLLKPNEEVELARCVRYLVEVEELQNRLTSELGHLPSRAELAAAQVLPSAS
jgi:Sigma-70 factor, region 1.